MPDETTCTIWGKREGQTSEKLLPVQLQPAQGLAATLFKRTSKQRLSHKTEYLCMLN